MKEILLANGMTTSVDDDVFDILNKYKWHLKSGYKTNYAARYIHVPVANSPNKKTVSILMHREIFGIKYGVEFKKEDRVDHINGNGLDNTIDNMRIVNTSINVRNSNHKGGITGYRGVQIQYKKYFVTHITLNGKSKHLGSFNTAEQAANAYDNAYREITMDDLQTNFKAPLGWCFITI